MSEEDIVLIEYNQKARDKDEIILEAIKYLESSGSSVSFDAVHSVLKVEGFDIDKADLKRRLDSLEKYSKIEKTTSRRTSFWRVKDGKFDKTQNKG